MASAILRRSMISLQNPKILTHPAVYHGWTWGENIKKEQWNLIYKIDNVVYQIFCIEGIHEA